MNINLKGKVAVITGGTSGIGAAATNLFLESGASVCVCDVRQDLIDQINERAISMHLPLSGIVADITNHSQMENLLNRTIEKFGKIDIFINNAGMGCPDGFLTINDNLWFREINVNLSAVIDACNLIIPYFERQGYGCILSTSSLCGRIAATVRSIYAITKCCVNVYTSSLAEELADKNIRVNAIAPGMVGTDMVKKNHPDPDDYRSLGKSSMLQRMGEPEEIAAAMVFLASDLASGITGEVLEVTGGKCVVQDPDYSWYISNPLLS